MIIYFLFTYFSKTKDLAFFPHTVSAVTSALKVGPVRLVNNHRFINFTEGASPQNSLLECGHQLEGEETVTQISWKLWDSEIIVGTFDWEADGNTGGKGSANPFRLCGDIGVTRSRDRVALTHPTLIYQCLLGLLGLLDWKLLK